MILPTNCRECHHSTNSSQLHDCAFTGAPYPTQWYCDHGNTLELLTDEYTVWKNCPLKETK